jgi:hypothetical protein
MSGPPRRNSGFASALISVSSIFGISASYPTVMSLNGVKLPRKHYNNPERRQACCTTDEQYELQY